MQSEIHRESENSIGLTTITNSSEFGDEKPLTMFESNIDRRSLSELERPTSAQIRVAWKSMDCEEKEKDMMNVFVDKFQIMESKNCSTENVGGFASENFDDAEVIVQDRCWNKFIKMLRSLWATRHTEDVDKNRDLYITTTLRELIIYMIFLVILMILTFVMQNSTMYYYNKVISELFLDAQYPDTKGSLRTSNSFSDFWRFTKHAFLPALFWDTWYNKMNFSTVDSNYIFYENKMLGVPRIRQVKVRPDSCTIASGFRSEIKHCYAAYSSSAEDTRSFGLANTTAWKYSTAEQTGQRKYSALLNTYEGGGFYVDLTRDSNSSNEIIDQLFNGLWIQRGTRVIFFDVTIYNANVNLFCVIKIVMEFPPTGGALTSWVFRTVKLIRYVEPLDYFVLVCEVIFICFILYYIVEETIEIRKHGYVYFKSIWNLLDVLVIAISMVCSIFNVYRSIAVRDKIQTLLAQDASFPDFDFLSYWQQNFDQAVAITLFFAWIKIFKYISFNKTMTQLNSTLGRCAKDLLGFSVMFFIIFFAFAQLGYLLFGTQVRDFREFQHSVFTLFRIILGDFDFNELENAHHVLGPLYFLLYVFFVFFILINMFLAIINDTYSEVKNDLALQSNDFEMGDYFKKRANRMMAKLHLKEDSINNIRMAIKAADVNHDDKLHFEEWRSQLKTCGFADAEIEALFAKYDSDGDRVLNMDEQKRMHTDLDDQEGEIAEEIENSGTDASKSNKSRNVNCANNKAMEEKDAIRHQSLTTTEAFSVLQRRVDRMEENISNIVTKIDSVLVKLVAVEKVKMQRRDIVGKILDSIVENSGDENCGEDKIKFIIRNELANHCRIEAIAEQRIDLQDKTTNDGLPSAQSDESNIC